MSRAASPTTCTLGSATGPPRSGRSPTSAPGWPRLAQVAADEDARAIVVGTYNGGALTLGRELVRAMRSAGCEATVVFGGVLNEDDGGPLPVDARPALAALGIRCVDEIEELGPLLAAAATSR